MFSFPPSHFATSSSSPLLFDTFALFLSLFYLLLCGLTRHELKNNILAVSAYSFCRFDQNELRFHVSNASDEQIEWISMCLRMVSTVEGANSKMQRIMFDRAKKEHVCTKLVTNTFNLLWQYILCLSPFHSQSSSSIAFIEFSHHFSLLSSNQNRLFALAHTLAAWVFIFIFSQSFIVVMHQFSNDLSVF